MDPSTEQNKEIRTKMKKLLLMLAFVGTMASVAAQVPKASITYNTTEDGTLVAEQSSKSVGLRALSVAIDPNITLELFSAVFPSAGLTVPTSFTESVNDFWKNGTEAAFLNTNTVRMVTAGNWRYVCVNDTQIPFFYWLGQPGGVVQGNWQGGPFRAKVRPGGIPISIDEFVFTAHLWDNAHALNKVERIPQYFREYRGKRADGSEDMSGPGSADYFEIRGIGQRIAFKATNPGEIGVVEAYAPEMKGATFIVEIVRGGVIIARAQVDVPFDPTQSISLQISRGLVFITGLANQQYRLEATSSFSPTSWQSVGSPVSAGNVPIIFAGNYRFFRALQGP
jgi:hypothetical protein